MKTTKAIDRFETAVWAHARSGGCQAAEQKQEAAKADLLAQIAALRKRRRPTARAKPALPFKRPSWLVYRRGPAAGKGVAK